MLIKILITVLGLVIAIVIFVQFVFPHYLRKHKHLPDATRQWTDPKKK